MIRNGNNPLVSKAVAPGVWLKGLECFILSGHPGESYLLRIQTAVSKTVTYIG